MRKNWLTREPARLDGKAFERGTQIQIMIKGEGTDRKEFGKE